MGETKTIAMTRCWCQCIHLGAAVLSLDRCPATAVRQVKKTSMTKMEQQFLTASPAGGKGGNRESPPRFLYHQKKWYVVTERQDIVSIERGARSVSWVRAISLHTPPVQHFLNMLFLNSTAIMRSFVTCLLYTSDAADE